MASKYSEDAKFVDGLVSEFSNTTTQLLDSVSNMISTIDGVAQAAGEGALGTTSIADRVSNVNIRSNEVMDQVLRSKNSAEKLKEEIKKFKI